MEFILYVIIPIIFMVIIGMQERYYQKGIQDLQKLNHECFKVCIDQQNTIIAYRKFADSYSGKIDEALSRVNSQVCDYCNQQMIWLAKESDYYESSINLICPACRYEKELEPEETENG